MCYSVHVRGCYIRGLHNKRIAEDMVDDDAGDTDEN